MSLRLFNTLSRKLEDFQPINPGQPVGLYTCGPTVYAPQHIGNMRYFIFVDVLKRALRLNEHRVKHVMNITDVGHLTSDQDTGDDKMEASAKKENRKASDIAAEITARFFQDLDRLNVLKADVVPFATKTIDLQIDLIKKLEERGFTYQISDGMYFDTSKFPHYGELSGQKSSEKKSGARVEVNKEKKNPADFALWKFSQPEEKRQMEWVSPWGTGFPGWHIECSAMSIKELGEQFDIHTGGVDHVAVHHENEIAQSEAATGKHPFVKYWLHGEFLRLPGKRMGKSEGNAITLQDVIEDHGMHPLAFRYLVLQTHYRKPLNFTWASLRAAHQGLNRLWATIAREEILGAKSGQILEPFMVKFLAAVDNDLNTAQALDAMHEVIGSTFSPASKRKTLEIMDTVLGLDLLGIRKAESVNIHGLESLLEEYETARREKRYNASDQIRKDLAAKGVTVEDLPDGTSRLRKKK